MDLSNLRERRDRPMLVSELNSLIKNMFDSNRLLSSVTVTGEISNFTAHRSGHLYFTLKDAEGQIRAVMFRSAASRLLFLPEEGMRVVVRGSVTVFARDGSYQLYVSGMQPDGLGSLYLAYEQMKSRLESEGLFDPSHKMSLPKFPSKIGVITSPTGAAVRDILNILSRRYPLSDVYIYPALVQGEGAVPSLIAGVDFFDKSGLCDAVIIGRGGGSIEELWAFNSEELARRIFAARVPIISAVGHETDFTICDFVCDLRAPTPSAAAELICPDRQELDMRVCYLADKCDRALLSRIERARGRLSSVASSRVLKEPGTLTDIYRDRYNRLATRLISGYKAILTSEREKMLVKVGKLEGLNPLAVLSRGFSATQREGRTVRRAAEVSCGDELEIVFTDGKVKVKAEAVDLK